MGKRPKLIPGNLYHIKMYNVFELDENGAGKFSTHEYIAELETLEDKTYQGGSPGVWAMMIVYAATQEMPTSELKWRGKLTIATASPKFFAEHDVHIPKGRECEEYYWQRATYVSFNGDNCWMDQAVFENYNPKRLPLYLDWVWGKDWIHKQLETV
jgi:hypothetical protein